MIDAARSWLWGLSEKAEEACAWLPLTEPETRTHYLYSRSCHDAAVQMCITLVQWESQYACVGNIHSSSNTAGRMSCGLFLLCGRPGTRYTDTTTRVKVLCRRIRTSRFTTTKCCVTALSQATSRRPFLLLFYLCCLLLLSGQEAGLRVDASPKG